MSVDDEVTFKKENPSHNAHTAAVIAQSNQSGAPETIPSGAPETVPSSAPATIPSGPSETINFAPGSTVHVRDEEWLVTNVEPSTDGYLVDVIGTSGITRDQEARFATALDHVEAVDPSAVRVQLDDSPGYRNARLWLESLIRRTPTPVGDLHVVTADAAVVDPLPYQQAAVERILSPELPRPRILLADTVGLGKTIEIGMILSELVRRGRGDRILIVTPKHVLEQMQYELWTRFALPFIRLDSVGIQRIRQTLPAGRNPFTFYKRVIISIDTLKSDQYVPHLRNQKWDAVVIDESHNVTNYGTQNNRLAFLLSRNTEALILASATPHNGNAESFNELVRMLEPSAVGPDGTLDESLVKKLVIRRHRHSPEVQRVVGAEWAERKPPRNIEVPATPEENAVAEELERTWLWPSDFGNPPAPSSSSLFPWTLAKAYLSSAQALDSTIRNRMRSLRSANSAYIGMSDPRSATTSAPRSTATPELAALDRLLKLNNRCLQKPGAKYLKLLELLRSYTIGRRSRERVVIFSERVSTLQWLRQQIQQDLHLPEAAVAILHGGLSDVEQQDVVESFKLASSPIRVLVTGDIASEGVNLHTQCHRLIHFDIPWSLIRIEQRNGRIDRYGQRKNPEITSLLLSPATEKFAGDFRVLTRLVNREHEAHRVLGEAGSLIGTYDVKAEEAAIEEVIRGQKSFDDVVRSADSVQRAAGPTGLLARIAAIGTDTQSSESASVGHTQTSSLFRDDHEYLADAVSLIHATPARPAPNGIAWDDEPTYQFLSFEPPRDLQDRLRVLPQTYLRDRHVLQKVQLVTTKRRGLEELEKAKDAGSTTLWPEAVYLSSQHPVMEWAGDRVLATLKRERIFAVRGEVQFPTVLVLGTLLNKRGQTVTAAYGHITFPGASEGNFDLNFLSTFHSAREAVAALHICPRNRLATTRISLDALMKPAVATAQSLLANLRAQSNEAVEQRVNRWVQRTREWQELASDFAQTKRRKAQVNTVEEEREYLESLRPAQALARPLLVVLPEDAA
ncbi:MAG: DEAD/DEAH box helicase [Ancrocorticia sp.]|nr:DEAD/DEAH box helicase [Ancrocorticia sp.]MCI2192692.1 DEAD/DEAH box helicase [Ancrocorticia sp.]